MNYKKSGEMLNSAQKMIDTYTKEKKTFNKKEKNELLERMSIALTGLAMLMSEYDQKRLTSIIEENGLKHDLTRAINRVKLQALPMSC